MLIGFDNVNYFLITKASNIGQVDPLDVRHLIGGHCQLGPDGSAAHDRNAHDSAYPDSHIKDLWNPDILRIVYRPNIVVPLRIKIILQRNS